MDNSNAYSVNPPLCRNYSDRFLVFDRGEGCRLYDITTVIWIWPQELP